LEYSAPSTGSQMARILLVEDDPNVLMLLEHVLRGADHDVDLAATVRQARAYLGKRLYDLVVADGKLPDGTGMAIGDAASAAGIETLIITRVRAAAPARGAHALRLSPQTAAPDRIAERDRAKAGLRTACSGSTVNAGWTLRRIPPVMCPHRPHPF
jgi:CheY-like chemotaxis protein